MSNAGGRPHPWGEAAQARLLTGCFRVEAPDKLRFTHGFHAYPGRMHPEIAERAIAAFRPKSVLDPFLGSGTVAVEAVRAGVAFTGVEISRVAIEIAWTRTRVWKPERCRGIEAAGVRIAKVAHSHINESFPVPPWAMEHSDWFDTGTLGEIGLLKSLIDEEKDADLRRALTCVLSSLLVKLSRQSSDSVTIREEGRKPWPPRAAFRLFREKCADLTKGLLLLSSDLHKRGVKPPEPVFRLADAREVRDAADLVLTSPPYPGTYDYSAHHALRFAMYGEREFAEEREIGSRRSRAMKYPEDLKTVLRNLLPTGAKVVMLIGDGMIGEGRVHADELVRRIARELGAKPPAGASRVQTEWTHGRRGFLRREHIILLHESAPVPVSLGR